MAGVFLIRKSIMMENILASTDFIVTITIIIDIIIDYYCTTTSVVAIIIFIRMNT